MTNEEWRNYVYHRKYDPFAEKIQPALLNSDDIKMYVKKGCLIERENFDEKRLKMASYKMRFLGELRSWSTKNDGTLEPRCTKIFCGDAVRLPRNSITYLWMKEKLLLPEYIAARFNLHIRHVHKGILLGTGPLVQPGFSGNLLIPLHNLTNNDYDIEGGDAIIWVEFTKISRRVSWDEPLEIDNSHDLKSFKLSISTPEEYLKESDIRSKGGVQSAFKGALEQAKNAAETTRKDTENFKKYLTRGGIASAIVIGISIGLLIMEGYSLVTQVTGLVTQITEMTTDIHHRIKLDGDEQSRKNDDVQRKIADLEARIDGYKDEVEELEREIYLMKGKQESDRKIVR